MDAGLLAALLTSLDDEEQEVGPGRQVVEVVGKQATARRRNLIGTECPSSVQSKV
jgi:hypothetical protein